ncbi:sulfate adenylyltransferase subunit CysN [Blochmannia endosymbiont of Polyrhachis (Hedomyrma) turneri]|uniref:sulfate adenylyltransferase subunit CysN n=1 Tax=Blochmannia endosymbiont of Polyrhachis (Hedomyrma) turneri TaxID=1505596 RepID=UPI00061A5D2F|nr:sulfate adenylyltransferase subunit CysN [Blochmannia endosymbiont of Polyrhachis (Hedomyrma) turneri]AKC59747.1 Sulfate adenylyltransferase subunit 1 [Blochmannia endosymbiont of Polyrhachis (Hedomyrma) turneri]
MNEIADEIVQSGGIENYLYKQQCKSLLRFLTCGSVDDGKSTLIGRLLYDSYQLYDDQLLALRNDSKTVFQSSNDQLNFAALVDGLHDERAQGITIDVAYRYFSTKSRKFIIADTPGHEQYTRNMATGASTSDLAILLLDARKGIRDQTRRHTFISILFGIRNFIIAINKMDLVDYDKNVFENIRRDYLAFIESFTMKLNIYFIPISALVGDNIIRRSQYMSWYGGSTLIQLLDTIEIMEPMYHSQFLRFPVQCVNYDHMDFRGYSGTVASGRLCVGKKIKVFPSGAISVIRRIVTFRKDLENAVAGDPVTVVLEHDLDINRGDIFLDVDDNILPVNSAQVDVVWMSVQNLSKGIIFNVQIAHKRIGTCVKRLHYQIDINNSTYLMVDHLPLNSIGLVDLVFDESMILDPYSYSPVTGSMIFIDPYTNCTIGAGMVRLPLHGIVKSGKYTTFELELHALIRRHFPHWGMNDLLMENCDVSS